MARYTVQKTWAASEALVGADVRAEYEAGAGVEQAMNSVVDINAGVTQLGGVGANSLDLSRLNRDGAPYCLMLGFDTGPVGAAVLINYDCGYAPLPVGVTAGGERISTRLVSVDMAYDVDVVVGLLGAPMDPADVLTLTFVLRSDDLINTGPKAERPQDDTEVELLTAPIVLTGQNSATSPLIIHVDDSTLPSVTLTRLLWPELSTGPYRRGIAARVTLAAAAPPVLVRVRGWASLMFAQRML